jgi:hypothetical protein
MAKRFLYIALLLILVNIAYVYSQNDEESAAESIEVDDLDSFFEGIENSVDDLDTPTFEEAEENEDSEVIEKEQEMYYPPPEPVPEFDNDTEKYIFYARKYLPEICLSLVFLVYILNVFVGKNLNSKLAAMWLSEALPMLKDNFHHLGFGDQPNASLSQISYSEYQYYGSGRDNCQYLFMHMKMKKRQDVIGGSLFGIIWPEKDRLILDIPIDADLPLELLLCPKDQVKKNQQEMPNINQLISQIKFSRLSSTNIVVLSESGEVADLVLSTKFTSILEKYEKYLEFLHFTDQKVYTNNPLVLKAEIYIGDSPAEFKNSVELVEALLELVDHIATNVKLPTRILDKAKKNRKGEEKKRQQVRTDHLPLY